MTTTLFRVCKSIVSDRRSGDFSAASEANGFSRIHVRVKTFSVNGVKGHMFLGPCSGHSQIPAFRSSRYRTASSPISHGGDLTVAHPVGQRGEPICTILQSAHHPDQRQRLRVWQQLSGVDEFDRCILVPVRHIQKLTPELLRRPIQSHGLEPRQLPDSVRAATLHAEHQYPIGAHAHLKRPIRYTMRTGTEDWLEGVAPDKALCNLPGAQHERVAYCPVGLPIRLIASECLELAGVIESGCGNHKKCHTHLHKSDPPTIARIRRLQAPAKQRRPMPKNQHPTSIVAADAAR
ncbi:hypothetical protein ACYCFL_05840 [Stutzerimonas nitrititolerans]|uniref:hypothetical protein n=1 Tax=Stutzerimonas nitrititolerans TaxID=2482751 RepID=UPI00289E8DF7|nr:hypothetical protein [Stutzerimonas nitrititolerans]